MNHQKFIILFLFNLCACQSEPALVQYSNDKNEIAAYNLISPLEANNLIQKKAKQYIPVQVSKQQLFEKAHIPGAVNIWRPDYGDDHSKPYKGLMADAQKIANLLQGLGFEHGKTLLLYDAKANVDALRFAWVLSCYGFEDYKLINGGLSNWKLNKLAIESGKAAKKIKSNYRFSAKLNHSLMASFDDVKASLQDSNTVLIDTREDYEFLAQAFKKDNTIQAYKSGAFERGCIPQAIHLNWSTLADLNGDHRIKSEKDLRFDLSQRGISPDKNIIVYCQSGSRSAHTYYVLKHVLGFPNVKNYDGSWIEWSYLHAKSSDVPIQQHCSKETFDSLYARLENLAE